MISQPVWENYLPEGNKKTGMRHTNNELKKQEGLLMAKNYSNTNNSNKNAKNSNSYGNTQSKNKNTNKNANKNSSNSYSNASDSRNCGRDMDAYDESDRY